MGEPGRRGFDQEEFRQLVEEYTPVLLGYLRGKTRHHAEIEDLVQEVFLAAYCQLDDIRNRDSIGAWLLTVARNKVSDLNSRKKRESLQTGTSPRSASGSLAGAIGFPEEGKGPDAQVETEELMEAVHYGMSKLNDKMRIIVHLRLWEELSSREIAKRLGLKESAVRMRLQRGLRLLRNNLRKRGSSWDEPT